MPRDYKNARRDTTGSGGAVMPFLAGLALGLLVAFGVLVYHWNSGPAEPPKIAKSEAKEAPAPKPKKTADVPAPTFDFYQILPNREVNLSEWVEEAPEQPVVEAGPGAPPVQPAEEKPGLYILQVGSFKTYEAADELKAQLALMGIDADIQRVVIDGQAVLHRVRIGPFRDPARIEETRRRLVANDVDFMVLRLKEEEAGG
jgi:cell division protein FtsN